jgi:hypothetical protein
MENFSIIISNYQKDVCSSSHAFAENLQIVLNISDEDARQIAGTLPNEISSGLTEAEAKKLAGILEAFGAVVILKEGNSKDDVAEPNQETDEIDFTGLISESSPVKNENSMMLFDIEEDDDEIASGDSLFIEKLDTPIKNDTVLEEIKPAPTISIAIEQPKKEEITSLVANQTEKVETISEIKQPEIPTLVASSPFLKKKRKLEINLSKQLIPTLGIISILLAGVYYLSTSKEPQEDNLKIKVDSELIKTILNQSNGAKNKQVEEKKTENNYHEGTLDTTNHKINVQVNQSGSQIEFLKISLENLTNKQTTEIEFIDNKFLPHLSSLEIDLKNIDGLSKSDTIVTKGTARVFYILKNNTQKNVLEISIGIKDNPRTLIISSSEEVLLDETFTPTPQVSLDLSNDKLSFNPFKILIPLNSAQLVIPKRVIISDSDVKDTASDGKDKKEAKKKKKAEKKVVDE